MLKVTHYPKQHYSTLFNARTGFFARIEDGGHPEPKWAENGPELIDISVTNWCDAGCGICYRSSSLRGRHMPVTAYRRILRQAAQIGVLQVALGGGNPNQHPSFPELLKMTRQEFGIAPSYTTNARGLTPQVVRASCDHCGAVAVSAHEPYVEFGSAVQTLLGSGIRTNVHFVLDEFSVNTAIEWLKEPPRILDGINALVFLNYKPVGRMQAERRLLRHNPEIKNFFELACTGKHAFRVGFDSCLVSGLVSFSRVNPIWFDACEAARFSMFISEDSLAFPCSFMTAGFSGVPIEEGNLRSIWLESDLFKQVRENLLRVSCTGCSNSNVCMGGCPLFDDINLCDSKREVQPAGSQQAGSAELCAQRTTSRF
jgi:radical SAM protein with 4Fe4S-binding SPASM domain